MRVAVRVGVGVRARARVGARVRAKVGVRVRVRARSLCSRRREAKEAVLASRHRCFAIESKPSTWSSHSHEFVVRCMHIGRWREMVEEMRSSVGRR